MPTAEHDTTRRSFLATLAATVAAPAIATGSVATMAAAADPVPEMLKVPKPRRLKANVESFANKFLLTDVAFLAADDEHVVLTVRIPRDKLALNHSILSVLSNYAGGAS